MPQRRTLLALADPEQRIYDFIGADPERLNHFRAAFTPTEVDLGTDNHRSAGTDIGIFGNDLLSGRFRKKSYDGIDCHLYEPYAAQARTAIVTTAYAARKRLVDAGRKNWSLAILVPTKKMTRLVSDTFRAPPAGMTGIPHVAAALLHGSEQIADLPVPVAESPGAVRIGHPERGHLVEYLAPNSVFNSLPRQRSSPHLRPDDRLVTIDRVFHHASLGAA